jgi:hypothetical protein
MDRRKNTFQATLNKIYNIFLKSPSAPAFWLILAFIFKGIPFLMVILNKPYSDIPGIWGASQGDEPSYFVPIDNLLKHGNYSPDYRMPGYGIVYLLFRLLFLQPGACNALILFQYILASLSVYYLSLVARNLFENDTMFYLTFYLFLICPVSNFYDAYTCTESLCGSMLIFSVYFFSKYFQKQEEKYCFISGLLFTWVMFLRPVFGGLIAACCFIFLLNRNVGFKIKLKHLLIFLMPFIICEGTWAIRNYVFHKKFIPLTSIDGVYPRTDNSYIKQLFEFGQSWGGVCSFTNHSPDMDWIKYFYGGIWFPQLLGQENAKVKM